MNLLDNHYVQKALDEFGVYNFDVQSSSLIIAGREMMDYTNISITPTQSRRTEQGIHVEYHTYVNLPNYYIFSISFLNGGQDVEMLTEMQRYFRDNSGAFEIEVVENGRDVGRFRSYMTNPSAIIIDETAPERTYEFVGVKMYDESELTFTPEEMENL